MVQSSRWVRSVLQLAAMAVVIAGAVEIFGSKTLRSGSLGQHAADQARAPDPETTSSVIRLMNQR